MREYNSCIKMIRLYAIISCLLQVIYGCALPSDLKPSWSIHSRSNSRFRRDVSLDDRKDCLPTSSPPVGRVDSTERVNNLIDVMKRRGLDAYIIPTADEHLSEYVSSYDTRRTYITGFSGSAGTAVVLADGRRALWTDGRYFLQADLQMDCQWLLMKEGVEGVPTIVEWLKQNLSSTKSVGADSKLVSSIEWEDFENELQESGITMTQVESNLIDEIWPADTRPAMKNDPLEVLELKYAGKSWQEKVAEVRAEMVKQEADLLVITAMDEVAWLLNLRGNDVENNPVFRGYIILDKERIRFFTNTNRVTPEVDLHLVSTPCAPNCLELVNYDSILDTLKGLSSVQEIKKVLLPKKYSYTGGSSYAIYASVPKEKRYSAVSPALSLKARKNPIEAQGMRNAHIRDAVALIDFLSFFEKEMDGGREWDELSASETLKEFRAEQELFKGTSFNTISGFGSNGAIIHYKPTADSTTKITRDSLYLLDSGGQYKDGTTDVTRTLHYGSPTDFQKEAYTRVLMGHLNLAMLVFPKGTMDTRIDVLARKPLFNVGLNYNHGTGHGIGMFLNIHESPTQLRIYATEEHELEEGHHLSDEPGFYKEGEFGIRIESIVAVVQKETKYTPDVPMLGFDIITLVPFEPKLIDYSLLTRSQCDKINEYNANIRAVISEELRRQSRSRALDWMIERTNPVSCEQQGEKLTSAQMNVHKKPFRRGEQPYYSTVAESGSSLPVAKISTQGIFLGLVFLWICYKR